MPYGPGKCAAITAEGRKQDMKIIVLGNQARALSNFWSVLIRRMRQGGHEVLCCAPPGDRKSVV